MPSSSAHWVVGRTTSAISAVSDRNMSLTTSRSSAFRPCADLVHVGRRYRDVGGEHQQHPDARFVVPPSAASNSQADRPGPGSELSSTPQMPAMCARCSGLSSLRYPGSWSAFWPCSRPPCPLPCPVRVPKPQNGLPDLAQRQRQIDEGQHVIDAAALLLRPARGQDHGGPGGAEHARGVLDRLGGDAGDPLHPVGPVGGDGTADGVEPRRPLFDERRDPADLAGSRR